ncbi:MAG: uroporphyrinogen-III C-methyltransferase [Candidatus Omnitrophica bacterium]|nr:uroporphyrinogen-III C-methyltransferase [Candidatus Omnitrophota bacterium]
MSLLLNTIRVASRSSQLACLQVNEIHAQLKEKGVSLEFERSTYQTQGDLDKKISLTENLPDNFFTDALDQALINCEVDIVVHSAKDLPKILHKDLDVFALTKTFDATDAFVGLMPFEQLKPGARIGTSSLIRQESIKKLNPNLQLVDIRGTIEERINLIEQGICDGIIVATCALKRLGLADKIQSIMPWEASPMQGQLAIVGRCGDLHLKNLFKSIDARQKYGKIFLVGAGPGDPDLITQKGINVLKQADCVFYDFLAHNDLLNYAPQAEKIYVGKRKGLHSLAQSELNRQLKNKVLDGKNVIRLKGGDPLIFGRGAEEIEYLRSFMIDVQVIPGVSSATAIPTALGVPLTDRNLASSVAFISAHQKEEDPAAAKKLLLPQADTLVFLMGLTKIKEIVQALKTQAWPDSTPVMVISRGTTEDQQIVTGTLQTIVAQLDKQALPPPALIIVGQTISFFNQSRYQVPAILYTGTNPEQYQYLGKVIHFPMIQIQGIQFSEEEQQKWIKTLHHFQLILLTSRFAVKYFMNLIGNDLNILKPLKFACIGRETALTLRKFSITPECTAKEEYSEGFLKELDRQFSLSGMRILFPRSSLPNPFLKEELEKKGAQVELLAVYKNEKIEKRDLPKVAIDNIVFTSPSTVKNFLDDYKSIPREWKVWSKGPVTSQYLKEVGYENQQLSFI